MFVLLPIRSLLSVAIKQRILIPDIHRHKTQSAFLLLLLGLHQDIRDLITAYAVYRLTEVTFIYALSAALLQAHTQASALGRQRAGDRLHIHAADLAVAMAVMGEDNPDVADAQQWYYLRRFRDDLLSGRYLDEDGRTRRLEKIEGRADLYAYRLMGTANHALIAALPTQTRIRWRLGRPESGHCDVCPELAERSEREAFTPATLPTVPGKGDTPCLFECLCHLEFEGGWTGFLMPA